MRAICSYSGLEFQIQYFPGMLDTGETFHPVFTLPLPKLFKYYPRWKAGQLSDVDSYLLFLAVLRATEMVEWRLPVQRTKQTDSIIATNMERLFAVVGKVSAIKHPRFVLPFYVISAETRTLDNVRYWLEAWEDQYISFCAGLKDQEIRSKLQKKEAALERLIRNPAIKVEKYATLLAAWAADAGQFPESLTITPQGESIPLSYYWQDIIVKCHDHVDMLSIPEADIAELLEYCEDNIDAGCISAYHLFNTLRDGLTTIQGFFSIGSTTFTLLDSASPTPDAIETANIANLVATAPLEAPKRPDYPSDFAFLRAKMKYTLALSQSTNEATK